MWFEICELFMKHFWPLWAIGPFLSIVVFFVAFSPFTGQPPKWIVKNQARGSFLVALFAVFVQNALWHASILTCYYNDNDSWSLILNSYWEVCCHEWSGFLQATGYLIVGVAASIFGTTLYRRSRHGDLLKKGLDPEGMQPTK